MADTSITPGRKRRMAREPVAAQTTTAQVAVNDRPAPRTELLLSLLGRDSGATLDQMMQATGWQPHSTRAALTGLRKKGHALSSEKVDGVRIYRLAKVDA